MAKNKPERRGRAKGGGDAAKIIALLVFILIGLSIIGGTVWYYAFHLPRATEEMEEITREFTLDYFNVQHDSITGEEGLAWVSQDHAQRLAQGDRVDVWKARGIISRVEDDVEVEILDQGMRSGKTRATFWQYEETEESTQEYLVYYDYEFVYEDGQWVIDRVLTASEQGLKDLRRTRGVYDQHYDDEEDTEDEEDGADEDEGESEDE